MESLNKDLILVVIASAINSSIKKLDNLTNESSIELDLNTFLSDINELIVRYIEAFDQKAINGKIDRPTLLSLLGKGQFGDFVQVSENSIKIEANAKAFQTILSNIAVTSTLNYAKFLIKNIDDLGIIYRQSETTKSTSEGEKDTNDDNNNDIEKYTIEEVNEEKEKEEDVSGDGNEDKLSTANQTEELEHEKIKEKEVKTDDEKDNEEVDAEISEPNHDIDTEMEEAQSEKSKEGEKNNEAMQDEEDDNSNDIVQDDVKEEQTDEIEGVEVEKENKDQKGEKNIESENEELQETTSSDLKENIETPEPKQDSKDEIRSQTSKKRSRSLSVSTPQQHKRFQHIAVNLINNIQAHRFSSPFLQPVNVKEAPDYHEIIYEPKDLKNILKSIKLKNDPPEYQLIKQLKRDILLMLANCIMYNKSDTDLVELTKSMKNDVNNIFKLFEEAELDTK